MANGGKRQGDRCCRQGMNSGCRSFPIAIAILNSMPTIRHSPTCWTRPANRATPLPSAGDAGPSGPTTIGASGPEVSMRWAGRRAAGAANAWRLVATPAFVLALGLAGCTTDGQPSLTAGRTATIAFESIDGPPQPVFQKLVESLASEAVARQVAVISREATPQYRIRGYLAAHVERGRTHIGWVWDVYDAEKRRALRIAGEEPGGRRGSDAWTAADEQMLRRIARTSMDRLAAFLAASGGGPPPAAPASDGIRVASAGYAAAPPALAAALTLADARR
jgi:hypothetical protein